jgi:hypothetical protein
MLQDRVESSEQGSSTALWVGAVIYVLPWLLLAVLVGVPYAMGNPGAAASVGLSAIFGAAVFTLPPGIYRWLTYRLKGRLSRCATVLVGGTGAAVVIVALGAAMFVLQRRFEVWAPVALIAGLVAVAIADAKGRLNRDRGSAG